MLVFNFYNWNKVFLKIMESVLSIMTSAVYVQNKPVFKFCSLKVGIKYKAKKTLKVQQKGKYFDVCNQKKYK